MKVLIVCSGNSGQISPFINEQVISLSKLGIEFDFYIVHGKGVLGYLSNISSLKKKILESNPHIIHAHYGLSGLLANIERSIPVITTFHGSDINEHPYVILSNWAHKLSKASIFVEEKMMHKVVIKTSSSVIPCAVNLSVFFPVPKTYSLQHKAIHPDSINVLFSSAFSIEVKNYKLAREACNALQTKTGKNINLIELKGYNREEVNILLNAVDCALLTSISEGSPQFIKEAMACNCPVVTTDVGDIKWLIGNTVGCYITSFEPEDVALYIKKAIEFGQKTKGRERIIELGLDSESVAQKIIEVYNTVLSK